MSINLVEEAKILFANYITPGLAHSLQEPDGNISTALNAIIPAIFGGLIQKSSTPDGAAQLAKAAQEESAHDVLASGATALQEADSRFNNYSGILGNNLDKITMGISNFANTKQSTSRSLISLALPAILGFLGRHFSANNVSGNGVANLLQTQTQHVKNALPASLSLSSLLGGASATPVVTAAPVAAATMASTPVAAAPVHKQATTYAAPVEEESNKGGGMRWIWPILLLALIGAGALYFFKKDGDKNNPNSIILNENNAVGKVDTTLMNANIAKATGQMDSTGEFTYDEGAMATITLPGTGGTIEAGPSSTEARLVSFLSSSQAVDTVNGNWFEFTNVRFQTGNANITETSMRQLENLVKISKAFPQAQFKIGGYTDNTGSEDTNMRLSNSRAMAVAAKLKALGATSGSITGAEGYGSQQPMADNAVPEGRAQNRRVAVRVKAK